MAKRITDWPARLTGGATADQKKVDAGDSEILRTEEGVKAKGEGRRAQGGWVYTSPQTQVSRAPEACRSSWDTFKFPSVERRQISKTKQKSSEEAAARSLLPDPASLALRPLRAIAAR